jgi:hypothetical protein
MLNKSFLQCQDFNGQVTYNLTFGVFSIILFKLRMHHCMFRGTFEEKQKSRILTEGYNFSDLLNLITF